MPSKGFALRIYLTKSLVFTVLAVLLVVSCKEKRQAMPRRSGDAELKESLIKANQYLMRNEEADIEAYIARRQWKMARTQTGLRYVILSKGSGPEPDTGNTVRIAYSISLINGEKIYDSEQEGLKTFVLGKSNEISGLEEGIFLLRQGDQAKFIIPSHLAFGLAGDDKKVPKRASLIYDVKLISVK
jgi:FKBP-type peptidyl-prolyl cis-trans isomerase